jgi:hypothetical protein
VGEPELPKPVLRLVVSKDASLLAHRSNYRPIRRTRVLRQLWRATDGRRLIRVRCGPIVLSMKPAVRREAVAQKFTDCFHQVRSRLAQ